VAQRLAGVWAVGLDERLAECRCRHALLAPSGGSATGCFADGSQGRWHVSQGVAHPMHSAALPGCAHHAPDRSLEALVRVRDHQLGAAQAALGQAAQERRPESLGFAGSDMQPHDLPLALCVSRHGDYGGNTDNAPALALLEVGGIQPKIRPVAVKRAVQEGIHPVIARCDRVAITTLNALRAPCTAWKPCSC